MPQEMKKYKVFTQNNWHVLLKTTRLFGQIQFVEDDEQLLGSLMNPPDLLSHSCKK